jgi:hypothetical protein
MPIKRIACHRETTRILFPAARDSGKMRAGVRFPQEKDSVAVPA